MKYRTFWIWDMAHDQTLQSQVPEGATPPDGWIEATPELARLLDQRAAALSQAAYYSAQMRERWAEEKLYGKDVCG